jgi:hypothetical protein
MTKEIRINVRTTEEIKTGLEAVAKLRGLKASSLINSLVVKAIREEKERDATEFERVVRHIAEDATPQAAPTASVAHLPTAAPEAARPDAPFTNARRIDDEEEIAPPLKKAN